MRHAIDPKIDCVFKALLGAEENRNLLIHFLNAFLAEELGEPIVSVDILNPYNPKEFISDKLSIVDVKAQDSENRIYQIEIQLTNHAHLPARIIYNWADIYSQQLKSGQNYGELKPTYSIWLLAENLLTHDNEYVHHYKLRDRLGSSFVAHGGIWLLELKKFKVARIESEGQRWLQFFKVGEQLNDQALPDWMITEEMKQAMTTLSTFSEKDREYFQYQARQEYQRVQQAIAIDQEQRRLALEQTERALEETKQKFLQTEQKFLQSEQKIMQTEQKIMQTEQRIMQTEQKYQQTEQKYQQTEQKYQQTEQAFQQTKQELLQTKRAEEQARLEKEAALAELERLKLLLSNKQP